MADAKQQSAEKPLYDNFRRNRYERSAIRAQAWLDGPGIAPFNVRFSELKRINVKRECVFPKHKHGFCEIFISESGSYECGINGANYRLSPGEAVIVQNGDTHSDRYMPCSTFWIVALDAFDIEQRRWPHGFFAGNAPSEARLLRIDKSPRLALLVEAMKTALPPTPDSSLQMVSALCQALFWEMIAQVPDELLSQEFKAIRGGSLFQARAREILDKTPVRDFSSSALSARLGMSKRAMEMRFKTLFGLSPERVFMAWKVEEAARLLASGFSVKEASDELGFANQFHFSRVFKRIAGRMPSAKA